MKFRTYLIATAALILLVTLLAAGTIISSIQTKTLAQQTVISGKSLTATIGTLVGDLIANDRSEAIGRLLIRFANLPEVKRIEVVDPSGTVLASVTRRKSGIITTEPATGETRASIEENSTNANDFLVGEEVGVDFVEPIDNGNLLGWVRLTKTNHALISLQREARTTVPLIASALTAFSLLLVWFLASKPFATLDRTAEFSNKLPRVREERLPIPTWPVELTQLSQGLNRNAEQLNETYQAKRTSDARRTAVLESSLDGIFTIDGTGKIVDFNPAAEEMFGYRREAVIGQDMTEKLVPQHLRDAHKAGIKNYLKTGNSPQLRKRIELIGQRSDGEEFPLEAAIVPVNIGKDVYFAATVRDIADRKRHDRDLQANSEKMQTLIRELERQKTAIDRHAMVCMTDRGGKITYANEKFVAVTGFSVSEMHGKTAIHDLLRGTRKGEFTESIFPTIYDGKVWTGELEGTTKDGTIFITAATFVPLLDSQENIDGIMCVQTDITAQKSAESDLAARRGAELAIGSHIQRSLLMQKLPATAFGLDMSACNEPSEGIDGDFYDAHIHPNGVIDIIVGDVMGKGVPAAMLGAATKMQISRSLIQEMSKLVGEPGPPSPANIIRSVNRALSPHMQKLESFVTLSYVRIDLERKQAIFVGCGHTEPIIMNQITGEWRLLENQHLPIGLDENEVITETNIPFEDDEIILMYSDGVTEASNHDKEQFGVERLLKTLRTTISEHEGLSSSLQILRKSVLEFAGNARRNDDMTAVLVRPSAFHLPDANTRAIAREEFDWDLNEIAHLRRFVDIPEARDYLSEDEFSLLTLALVEAFTNIVRHAQATLPGSPIECSIRASGTHLEYHFSYFAVPFIPSTKEPSFPNEDGMSEGGMGMFLIDTQSDSVDYSSQYGVNKTVIKKRYEVEAVLTV